VGEQGLNLAMLVLCRFANEKAVPTLSSSLADNDDGLAASSLERV